MENQKTYEEQKAELGECQECHKRLAKTDYNGHGYYVCYQCDDKLNRYFDEEYR